MSHAILTSRFFWIFIILIGAKSAFGQHDILKEIESVQKAHFESGDCLDFVRDGDIAGVEEAKIQQIIIIRHGEPAMDKKGWRNRNEAIRYTEMYDSVGVYDFDKMPICLRDIDMPAAFTSRLPRAINTAEKTLEGELPFVQLEVFNEFERKIIKFPNVRLPMKFWSITTRLVWIMGFNNKGIESFSDAKNRSEVAAEFLDKKANRNGKALLFSHGFLNKYIKRYLKKSGYKVINLNGQQYLGAYYFYKIIDE